MYGAASYLKDPFPGFTREGGMKQKPSYSAELSFYYWRMRFLSTQKMTVLEAENPSAPESAAE
jgi:hypothetical protein